MSLPHSNPHILRLEPKIRNNDNRLIYQPKKFEKKKKKTYPVDRSSIIFTISTLGVALVCCDEPKAIPNRGCNSPSTILEVSVGTGEGAGGNITSGQRRSPLEVS